MAGSWLDAGAAEPFALRAAIAEVSGGPGVGLSLGVKPHLERLDATPLAAVCSRRFRDALERDARGQVLTCPEDLRVTALPPERWYVARARVGPCGVGPENECRSWAVVRSRTSSSVRLGSATAPAGPLDRLGGARIRRLTVRAPVS